MLVILCGLLTTIISLVIVSLLASTDFNLIGWYVLFIIPAGALIVGMASGTGYFIGSKLTNSKIAGIFIWLVFFISVAGYIGSHYVTYRALGEIEGLTFLEYIKITVENFTFGKIGEDGEAGTPLGKWGYLFLVLEGIGFSVGAMVPALCLSGAPYCDSCKLYLKKTAKGHIPSASDRSALKKQSKPEKVQLLEGAINEVVEASQVFGESIAEASYEDTMLAVGQLDQKPTAKSLASSTVQLMKCPHCSSHHAKVVLANCTVDGQANTTDLFEINKPDQVEY